MRSGILRILNSIWILQDTVNTKPYLMMMMVDWKFLSGLSNQHTLQSILSKPHMSKIPDKCMPRFQGMKALVIPKTTSHKFLFTRCLNLHQSLSSYRGLWDFFKVMVWCMSLRLVCLCCKFCWQSSGAVTALFCYREYFLYFLAWPKTVMETNESDTFIKRNQIMVLIHFEYAACARIAHKPSSDMKLSVEFLLGSITLI